MGGLSGLREMVRKEFLQVRRDRRMIPMLVMGPVIQVLAFGFAANSDVTDVPLLVADLDRSAASRELAERFVASGYFEPAGTVATSGEIEPPLVDGRAQVALVLPAGFGRQVAAGRPAEVQLIADGSDAASAVVGLGYASRIVGEFAAASAAPAAPVAGPRVRLVPRVWYNPDLKSRWFYVPAVVAMVLMLVTMILPSMAVVREKEIGTMEQLIVTPVRSWQVVVGKLVPFGLFGLLDTLLVTGLAVGLFRVPLNGSLPVLLGLTALFLLSTLGLGLLASTLVRTQQQAMLVSTFLFMVPFIYLSGLIFPIENMPRPIQLATHLIPVRYYAVVLRGVFLKGSGLDVLWPEALILLAYGLGILAVASLRFRKSLD